MSEEAHEKKAKYHSVNGAWPEGTNDGRDIKPTPQEAMSAAKRLYRFAMKRPFKGKVKLTSGNRYTWIKSGVLYVNPDQGAGIVNRHLGGKLMRSGGGWHELVHAMSHYCASRLYPRGKPHGAQHAFLEKEMIEHVVNSGWLEGKLKRPEKPQPEIDVKQIRRDRVLRRIEAWEAKRRRAENALKKLRKQARYYDRTIAA